tara:strand:+ start:132 stop:512 length:381 start_codon:yes stop_codon:yes gene_type:complete
MTKDWKTDFDWTDPNDVQLETIKENSKVDPEELGPDNREACNLMEAQNHLLKYEKKYEEPIVSEPGEFQHIEGVGKDIFGKYSYAVMEHKGKQYFVQVREKELYDGYNEYNQGRLVGPKIEEVKVQ